MPWHYFTIGGSTVYGFRVEPDGAVVDFKGSLRNFYSDLNRASMAARRKYADNSITITETVSEKKRYRVDMDDLLSIAESCND